MSGTEEAKEQVEVVMEDSEKSMPSTQHEVLFNSLSFVVSLDLYVPFS